MKLTERFRFLLVCGICGVSTELANQSWGGEKHSLLNSKQSEIVLGPDESIEIADPLLLKSDSTKTTKSSNVTAALTSKAKSDSETIRERFQDGRVRIEKQVALDRDGNYTNHGTYSEWASNGDIVSSGTYEMGQRDGTWIRIFKANDAKLFSSPPYSNFKAPFISSVDFKAGEMHGLWVIADIEKRVVSQVQLSSGIRDGQSTWWHPNGMRQALLTFNQGEIEGDKLAWNEGGKRIPLPQGILDGVIQELSEIRTTTGSVKPLKVRQASILVPSESQNAK